MERIIINVFDSASNYLYCIYHRNAELDEIARPAAVVAAVIVSPVNVKSNRNLTFNCLRLIISEIVDRGWYTRITISIKILHTALL